MQHNNQFARTHLLFQLLHLTLIFFIFAIPSETQARNSKVREGINAQNDHGFWLEESISKKFESGLIQKLRFEQRWASNYRILYNQGYEFFLHYDVIQTLSKPFQSMFSEVIPGAGLRLSRLMRKNTRTVFHWVTLLRPMIEVQLTSILCEWKIKQRIRFEYINYLKQHYRDHAVGRYRLEIHTPWKWSQLKISPYMMNELFFRKNTYGRSHPNGQVGGMHENRFRVGLTFDLFEHLSSTVYWQWITRKRKPEEYPQWLYNYQIGLILDSRF